MMHSGLENMLWSEIELSRRNLRKLGAIIESFDEIKYCFDSWSCAKKVDPLLVKCAWSFKDVLLLVKIEHVTFLWYFFAMDLVLCDNKVSISAAKSKHIFIGHLPQASMNEELLPLTQRSIPHLVFQ